MPLWTQLLNYISIENFVLCIKNYVMPSAMIHVFYMHGRMFWKVVQVASFISEVEYLCLLTSHLVIPQMKLSQIKRSGLHRGQCSAVGISFLERFCWGIDETPEHNDEVAYHAGTRIHVGYREYEVVICI